MSSEQSRLNSLDTFPLREKCPYSDFFESVFSHIRKKHGELWSISPYSVQMRENTDQKNSEYGHFSRSNSGSTCLNVKDPRKGLFPKNGRMFESIPPTADDLALQTKPTIYQAPLCRGKC